MGARNFKGYELHYRPGCGPIGRPWQYVHENYDGPGDSRHGWARTWREAETLISDEVEEMAAEQRAEEPTLKRWRLFSVELWPGDEGYDQEG